MSINLSNGASNKVFEIPITMSNTETIHATLSDKDNKNNQKIQVENNAAIIALSKKLDVICDRLKSMDEEDLVQTEWRAVAMTIDCIIFWVFIAICTLTILACTLCIPGYRH